VLFMSRSRDIDPSQALTRRQILWKIVLLLPLSISSFLTTRRAGARSARESMQREEAMKLPRPRIEGFFLLERAIKGRRTIRNFRPEPLTQEQFSQILWAAQGITEDSGFKRACPSAGALYPMEIYAVVGSVGVMGFRAGVYHYGPKDHAVGLVSEGDCRNEIARAALSQMWMARAPVNFVITAEYERVTIKYGKRGVRYAMIEAGHIGQNIFLQGEGLGLGVGIVGAFHDEEVIRVMNIPPTHEPLVIMPVGYKG